MASLKDILKEKSKEVFCKRWHTNPECKVSRQLWPEVDTKKSKRLLSLSKLELRKLFGGITGHCLNGKHAKLLNIRPSERCRFCDDVIEDMEHLFCDCPALARRRFNILGSYFFEELSELSFLDLSKILKFIKVLDIL